MVLGLLRRRVAWVSLAAFGVMAGGWFGYLMAVAEPARRAELAAVWESDLSIRADLRRRAVEFWVDQRFAVGQSIAAYPSVRALLTGSGNPVDEALTEILRTDAEAHQQLAVWVADGGARVVAASPAAPALEAACARLARTAMAAARPSAEFHSHASGPLRAEFAYPVPSPAAGAVVTAVEPGRWLYPFLTAQPTAVAATAETVLIQADGADALYVGPLRLASDRPPLTLRRSRSAPSFAAAAALDGADTVARYVDYRGVPVIAAVRAIHNAPWGLVVKVDEAELDALFRAERSHTLLLSAGALLLLAAVWASGLLFVSARQSAEQATLLEGRVASRTAELGRLNEELEAFTYSVAHDLRAPLRVVAGLGALLAERHGGRMDDEGRRILDLLGTGVRQAERLIDDLLTLSRASRVALDMRTIDMRRMAADVWAEVTRDRDPAPALDLEALPLAWGDPSLVRQVWVNLLDNAVKFSSRSAAPAVVVRGRAHGDRVEYEVSDNGVGFNPEHAGRLFGAFQRLHAESEYPGTGIGLAIVRRIVRRHGGDASASSREGGGATFGFWLPRV